MSGRMLTDFEMNGTLRGAVEEYNLCVNVRRNDVLFAEFIRSFPSVTIDAKQWLHRLEVELGARLDMQASVFVLVTKTPHVRSKRSAVPLGGHLWLPAVGRAVCASLRVRVHPALDCGGAECSPRTRGTATRHLDRPRRQACRT